jgi:hypothetical protein
MQEVQKTAHPWKCLRRRNDRAVAQGQQAMLPDGAVNGFGAVGQDVKKKKRRNKKSGAGSGNNHAGSNGAAG